MQKDENQRFLVSVGEEELDLETYPELSDAVFYETILEAGEVIFIPGGSPHQVSNLDDIVAVSMNYLDAAIYEHAVEVCGTFANNLMFVPISCFI